MTVLLNVREPQDSGNCPKSNAAEKSNEKANTLIAGSRNKGLLVSEINPFLVSHVFFLAKILIYIGLGAGGKIYTS